MSAAAQAAQAVDGRPLGFIGIGLMGEPMALNLVRAGERLVVWNRTAERTRALAHAGANVATDVEELFAQTDTVILMLADEGANDSVLRRGRPGFASIVRGHTLVHMGTTSTDYSRALESDVRAAGGRYVEAPVSGSRVPAQRGELVVLLAGEQDAVAAVRPRLSPLSRATVDCGAVPNGLLMKIAVNVFLITQVTGLAESVHLAAALGLDLERLAEALNAGQMASDISRVKLAKVLSGDMSPQAAIRDVLKNNRLVVEAARAAGASSPLIDVCHALYSEAVGLGLGATDMVNVLRAIEARDTTVE